MWHLVELGEHLFMDMYPDPNDALSDAYKLHLVAAHAFSKSNSIRIVTMSVLMSNGFNIALIRDNEPRPRTIGPGDLVLTASTS